MQTPSIGDRILQHLASIGWFDWTAIAVIAVFLVLGTFRGASWQASRLAILVAAYVVALAFGGSLAKQIEGWFSGTGDPALHHHVAHSVLFVGVLVLVGVLFWLLQRFGERPQPTPRSRLLGAVGGACSGALVVLAMVTGFHMYFGPRDAAAAPRERGSIARAAESSTSAAVGRRALEFAQRLLPADLADGARAWRQILRDPRVVAAEAASDSGASAPVEGDFRRSDGVRIEEAPARGH